MCTLHPIPKTVTVKATRTHTVRVAFLFRGHLHCCMNRFKERVIEVDNTYMYIYIYLANRKVEHFT